MPIRLSSNPKISLCMIVKNESANLPRCLKSVEGVVDEVIIVDTGSTDASVEIAQKFGARVLHHEWQDDFGEARNVGLAQAQGDWILFLDADEELSGVTRQELVHTLRSTTADGLYVIIFNYMGDFRRSKVFTHRSVRLFRHKPGYVFHGKIHEGVAEVIVQAGGKLANTHFRVNHYGYLTQTYMKKKKSQRNLPILLKEVEDNPREAFCHFNLGMEYQNMLEFEKAISTYRKAFSLVKDPTASFVPLLLRNLVLCLMETRKFDDALKVLQDAKQMFPLYTELIYLEGKCYQETFRYQEAVASFKGCLARGDENIALTPSVYGSGSYLAAEALGDTYNRMGDLSQAVQAYKSALTMEPGYYPPLEKLAQLVLPRENIEKALPFLRTLTRDKKEGLLILAQQLAASGFKTQALALLDELGPDLDDDKLLSIKGQTLMVAGEYARALVTFEAIPLTSEAYETTLVLRIVLRDIAGGTEGKSVWDEIAHADFKEHYLQFLKALDLTLRQQDTSPALEGWKRAANKEDNNFYQLRIGKVADLLLALHEFDAFPRVIALFKVFGVSAEDEAITLARLYRKHNFRESAATEAIKAIQMGKEEADLYVILGETAMDQNLTEEAEVFYRKAVELEPEKVGLYTSLIKILIAGKKYREANLLCEEAMKVSPDSDLLKGVSNLIKSVSNMETAGKQFGG